MKRVDREYLHQLLSGINKVKGDLAELIGKKLERKFEELDAVEAAALYIGCFELVHRIDIPYRVAINESVELAKQFGATESHKLVNSVLDSIAKECRSAEYGRR
jgi:N utilization substance protein B